MRILLVNLAVESVQAVERALLGHGYEIIKVSGGTVEEVRSAKMLAENVDCAWPGFKKEFGSQKNSS